MCDIHGGQPGIRLGWRFKVEQCVYRGQMIASPKLHGRISSCTCLQHLQADYSLEPQAFDHTFRGLGTVISCADLLGAPFRVWVNLCKRYYESNIIACRQAVKRLKQHLQLHQLPVQTPQAELLHTVSLQLQSISAITGKVVRHTCVLD